MALKNRLVPASLTTPSTAITASVSFARPIKALVGLGFSRFAWIPNSNTVVAATGTTGKGFDEGSITSATNRGLYLSTDAGQSWTFQTPTDSGTAIAQISA